MISMMKKKMDREISNTNPVQRLLSWQHCADRSRWRITGETVSLAGITYGYDEVVWPEIRPR
jgi:hypothetical protein